MTKEKKCEVCGETIAAQNAETCKRCKNDVHYYCVEVCAQCERISCKACLYYHAESGLFFCGSSDEPNPPERIEESKCYREWKKEKSK